MVCPMKLTLFGSTGMIGSRILTEALDRGHQVVAVSRRPGANDNSQVTSLQGDVLDPLTVARLGDQSEAVVSAISPSQGDPLQVVHAVQSLIEGLSKSATKRLIVVGGAGGLKVGSGVRVIDDPNFPVALRAVAEAHIEALDILREKGKSLEWTYAVPAATIRPGVRTHIFQVAGDHLVVDEAGNSEISAEDFAVAVLNELERPAFIRKRFTVGYSQSAQLHE
jgi:putative NADH-flavin reductase